MNPDRSTDDLVELASAGVESAFVELAERERARVWAICIRITGNRQDAEDAVQETLIAAWRGIATFRGDAQFSTWLFRIASNAALAQVKRRKPTDPLGDVEPRSHRDISDEVTSATVIQEALDQLPEGYRTAFILRAYGDLSYADIAEQLGIPVQTVRSRLFRAKAMLRSLLAP